MKGAEAKDSQPVSAPHRPFIPYAVLTRNLRNGASPRMSLSKKFETYVPPKYAEQQRRILYVGKATRGDCQDLDYRQVHEDVHTPFWHFARRISKLADPNVEDTCNLAWSNIFKQGVAVGNPGSTVAEAQRAESIEMLRDELVSLKPTLIVLVNAGYYEDIPRAAYGIGYDGPSALTETPVIVKDAEYKYALWSRPAYEACPPIVWMYHPERKPAEYLDQALELIQNVAGW